MAYEGQEELESLFQCCENTDDKKEEPLVEEDWVTEEERYCKFNVWITSSDTDWIEDLYNTLYPLPGSMRHRETFQIILLNMAMRRDCIYLDLHKSRYTGTNLPVSFLPSKVSEICGMLERNRYLEIDKGYNVSGGMKKATLVAPSSSLLDLIPSEITFSYQRDGLIVTKDFTPSSYPPDVVERQEALEAYNKTVEPQNMLYATYKGSFAVDGRFTGSSVISMSKERRRHIAIQGEKTVEIDVSNCIPFLLYAKHLSQPVPCDVYRIDELPRGLVKKAVLMAVNCESREEARKAIQSELNLGKHGEVKQSASYILQQIETMNPDILEYLYVGEGRRLMNLESCCMTMFMKIMLSMTIPFYPIYDSVRVPESYRKVAEKVLKEAFTVNGVMPGTHVVS
ncbi:hypothetical protein [Desulfosediminicola ganghwensis]|uniref:hypothetical protein n=1 Tax=Desulfosediminicola ganghwensis TaxID=2569540 RepID=UPI0010AD6814|nr:hypothetical protein [Desulfosediminicola ganghwensis]